MSKSKNKKSWIEKLVDADKKQEAQLRSDLTASRPTFRKKSSDQTLDTNIPRIPHKVLMLLTLLFPFIAWAVAAVSNPTGWASADLSIIYITILFLPLYLWFVSVPLLIVVIYLVIAKRAYSAAVIIFLTSLIASLYIFSTTISANESEFTG